MEPDNSVPARRDIDDDFPHYLLPRQPAGGWRPSAQDLPQQDRLPEVVAVVRSDGLKHLETRLLASFSKQIGRVGSAVQLGKALLEAAHSLVPFFSARGFGIAGPAPGGVLGRCGLPTVEPLDDPLLPEREVVENLKGGMRTAIRTRASQSPIKPCENVLTPDVRALS